MIGGGPIFPQGQQRGGGLTRRDWFAAHALAGLTVNPPSEMTLAELARDAFDYADAMLAEGDRR